MDLVVLVGYSFTEKSVKRIISEHPHSIFVSDNPYCCELLDGLGQPCRTTEEFVPSDRLSRMGEEDYQFLDHFITECNQELLKRYYFTYKRILDCIHTAQILGSRLEETFAPAETWIYTAYPEIVSYAPYSFEFHECYYVRCLARSIHTGHVMVCVTKTAAQIDSIRRILRRKIGSFARAFLHSTRLIQLGWRFVLRRRTYLLTDVSYDVAVLHADLKLSNRNNDFVAFNPSKVPERLHRLILRGLRVLPCGDNEIRLWIGVVENTLNDCRTGISPEVWESFQEASCQILESSLSKNLNCFRLGKALAQCGFVKAALSPCIATTAESFFLQGVTVGGGQTFHYQHGGGQGYLKKKMSAWFNSQTDSFFSYGQVVPEHQGIEKSVRVIPAGSYRLEKMMARLAQSPRTPARRLQLVCVPAFPLGHRSYFPDVKKSDLGSYFLWRQLLRFLLIINRELNERYSIVVKTAHFLGPEQDYFFKLRVKPGYQSVRVVSGESITRYLQEGDVFLTDNPETFLLEAILTQKPVLLYHNGGYTVEPYCSELLNRRVFCIENERQLRDVLTSLATDYEGTSAKKQDKSFLNYNLHKTQPPLEFFNRYFPPLKGRIGPVQQR